LGETDDVIVSAGDDAATAAWRPVGVDRLAFDQDIIVADAVERVARPR
jgi:hypothetical protein